MKTKKIIFAILLIFTSFCVNAQLKVLQIGQVQCNNQTVINSNPNNTAERKFSKKVDFVI